MDQSDGGMMNEDNQSMFFGASNNVEYVGAPNNSEQHYSNKVFQLRHNLKCCYCYVKMRYTTIKINCISSSK